MENTYKVISISDVVEWDRKGEITLNPKYQRNTVWNDKTRSYLIDTILRGLPMPPVFMRQTIDVATRTTNREIVDGQQRLRAIIDYSKDKYVLLKSHNPLYGGSYFDDLPYAVQEHFLSYPIFAVIIGEKDDNAVYDMFARLNTNNYVLNRQEIRNAKYWGDFKIAVYNLAAEYRSFFSLYNIFSDKSLSRMDDAELVSSLMNLIMNGITSESPTILDRLYDDNNKVFSNGDFYVHRFKEIMSILSQIYPRLNSNNFFTSKVPFYTLFAAIYEIVFGHLFSNDSTVYAEKLKEKYGTDIIRPLSESLNDFNNECYDCLKMKNQNNPNYSRMVEFGQYHRSRTTNKEERMKRIQILLDYLCDHEIF